MYIGAPRQALLLGRSFLRRRFLGGGLLRRRFLRGGLLGRCLLRGLVVGVRGAARLARLDAGLQLGQQVGDVLGLVEFGGLLLGGERLAAFEFRLHQLVQLLLVVVAELVGVEV